MPGSVVVCLHVGLLSKRFRVQISARVEGLRLNCFKVSASSGSQL